MITIARNWRVVVGGVAAGSAAVLGFAGASASADPVLPPPPAPVTVAQAVPAVPNAAPLAAIPTAAAGPAATAPLEVPTTVTAAPTAAAAPETLVPAQSGTMTDFFKGKGVTLEPQKAEGFTAINIVLPMPRGWSVVPAPNVPTRSPCWPTASAVTGSTRPTPS